MNLSEFGASMPPRTLFHIVFMNINIVLEPSDNFGSSGGLNTNFIESVL
jgi:hypothetical protein